MVSGPIVDRLGRKRSIMVQNVFFLIGTALQTGAQSEGGYSSSLKTCSMLSCSAYHFAGRVLGGIAVGALTHVVPMYIAEVRPSGNANSG